MQSKTNEVVIYDGRQARSRRAACFHTTKHLQLTDVFYYNAQIGNG